jgi:hypothetical protein
VNLACIVGALALSLLSCAHAARGGSAEGAQAAAELFHHRARWKDYGGAALLLVPERRVAFEEARRRLGDLRDLSIADYQLEEISLGPDARSARVVSHVSWHRLPSITQHDEAVVTELEWIGGVWLIARQSGGPFGDELSGGAK